MLMNFKGKFRGLNFQIIFFILVHIIFSIVGFLITDSKPEEFLDIENEASVFFINNFSYGLILIAGATTFGLLTISLLSMNAYVLGVVIKGQVLLGSDNFYIVYNLLHGLLELPALYCFYAIGMTPIRIVLLHFFKKEYKFNFLKEGKQILRYFIYGTVLLLLAAILESIL